MVWRCENGDNSDNLIHSLSSFFPHQLMKNEIPYQKSYPHTSTSAICLSCSHRRNVISPCTTDHSTALIGQPRQFPPTANPPPPNHQNHPLPRRQSFAIWIDDDQRWPVSPHSLRNECRGRRCGDLDTWYGSFFVSMFATSRLSISLGSGAFAASYSSNSIRGPMDESKASHGRCRL